MLGGKLFFSASKCAEFVDMVFEVMAEALERGEKIKISGFGNFGIREKQARTGRNPQTGERMEIAARRGNLQAEPFTAESHESRNPMKKEELVDVLRKVLKLRPALNSFSS